MTAATRRARSGRPRAHNPVARGRARRVAVARYRQRWWSPLTLKIEKVFSEWDGRIRALLMEEHPLDRLLVVDETTDLGATFADCIRRAQERMPVAPDYYIFHANDGP